MVWFRLGGPASYFANPRQIDELIGLLKRCRDEGIAFKILGGGSNVLVRDEGVDALVIHLESPFFLGSHGPRQHCGGRWRGTTDGPDLAFGPCRVWPGWKSSPASPAPSVVLLRGNAGGRQGAIGQFVRRATVLDPADLVQVRERDDLSFADRDSNLDEPVILSAEFELVPEDPESVVRRMRRIWIIKKENQPYGHQLSGCIFKNPRPTCRPAHLIDQAGLKGTRFGGAEVSDRHANFIVAHPGAKSADVLELIDRIRQRVWQQFGYELELQIQIW